MLRRIRLRAPRWWLALGLALIVTGCGSGAPAPGAPQQRSITLYTCVNDTTVQPVIKAFQVAHPGREVKLFRAPTGELNARVASDARSGGLKADVIWACDPLTMRGYLDQQLLGGWLPAEAAAVPAQFRTADSVGAAYAPVAVPNPVAVPVTVAA